MKLELNIGGSGSRRRLLGIPPSVRSGRQNARCPAQTRAAPAGVEGSRGRGKSDLLVERVLEEGKRQEAKIIAMLNTLELAGLKPGVMPEFDRLVEQLGEVQTAMRKAAERLGG